MKQYLIDTFKFNDHCNKLVLEKMSLIEDKQEAVRLFSHLIHCQFRWYWGIVNDKRATEISWWGEPFIFENLELKWTESLQLWLNYLENSTEEFLITEVQFTGWSGGDFAAKPMDIALQLNYHSIHHRAQIQTIIKQQGVTPHSVEYINLHYRNL